MNVRVADRFWSPRMETNRTVTLPLEYEINQKSGILDAYQWDWWDPAKGKPIWRCIVGDLGKWIEAASYSLANHPDAKLQQKVEYAIEKILKGQKDDGYIYPNPMTPGWRFTDLLETHELYELGHDIEAALAH